MLSAAKLYVKSLDYIDEPERQSYALGKTVEAIDEAIQSIREISNNISPHILKNLGLVHATRAFTEKITDTGRISIRFNARMEERVDLRIETALYRIVEELIHNTIKYSGAGLIRIDLETEDHSIRFRYSDDGKGFDLEKALQKKSGSGLKNIQNRIESLKGEVRFSSELEKGMKVEILLPMVPRDR
jgi:signal transduction histidine kinase